MAAEDYINKMYDSVQDKQKKLLMDAYTGNNEVLDTEKKNVQQQTETNLERTDVEAQRVQNGYKPEAVSGNVNQQVALAMGNQQRKNTGTLRDVQTDAEAQIERERQLLGQQYAAAIKQAQAENDMLRAQQLYEQAKQADAQFSAAKTDVGRRQVELVNQIYDNANEAERQKAESATAAILSQLQAQREQQQQETDRKLTDVYVNALRQGQASNEMQNAYGLGSGNRAQRQLARELETTEGLTELRGVQTGADAAVGQKVAAAIREREKAVTGAVTQNERKRAEELLREAMEEAQRVAALQPVGQSYGRYYGEEPPVEDEYEYSGTGVDANKTGTGPLSEEGKENAKNRHIPAYNQLQATLKAQENGTAVFANPTKQTAANKSTAAKQQSPKAEVSSSPSKTEQFLESAINTAVQYALGNVYTQAAIDRVAATGASNAQPIVSKNTVNKLASILANATKYTPKNYM